LGGGGEQIARLEQFQLILFSYFLLGLPLVWFPSLGAFHIPISDATEQLLSILMSYFVHT